MKTTNIVNERGVIEVTVRIYLNQISKKNKENKKDNCEILSIKIESI